LEWTSALVRTQTPGYTVAQHGETDGLSVVVMASRLVDRLRQRTRRRRRHPEYDAFVSYNRSSDRVLAEALQAAIETYARPWLRRRALRVFRDDGSLAATPALWPDIESALSSSSWFILLASPEAVASDWVNREVAWWLEHKPAQRIVIVLTSGVLRWDPDACDFDWNQSTAAPPALRGAFQQEPRWVSIERVSTRQELSTRDESSSDQFLDVAAAIRGVSKDELKDFGDRELRRTVRRWRAATAGLAVLLILVLVAGLLAVRERDDALQAAKVALSRQLAVTSQNELSTNLDVALLLAARAYRTDPNPQTLSALLQADSFSPRLARYIPMGGQIRELAGSGDGTTVVAGLSSGQVVRWTPADQTPRALFSLPAAASSVAVSRDGATVAATDGTVARLWRRGHPAVTLASSLRQDGVVALSPSGRTAVVCCGPPADGAEQSLLVLDLPQLAVRGVHGVGPAQANGVLPSDDQLTLIDGYGGWERWRVSDWALEGASSAGLGAHQALGAPSSDGGSFSATNGDPTIPVWRTRGVSDSDHPGFTAEAPIQSPSALALSPDGANLAVADSGAIYVAPVAPEGSQRPTAVTLPGNGSVNVDGLRFFGDGAHLLSASRDVVAVWDLDQVDRLARSVTTSIEGPCFACGGPSVAVSPDGRRAAIVSSQGDDALIQPLPGTGGRPEHVAGRLFSYGYNPPVWDDQGHLVLPFFVSAGGSNVSAPTGLPAMVRAWPAGAGGEGVEAAQLSSDRHTVIMVSGAGEIYLQDAETGALRARFPGPPRRQSNGSGIDTAAVGSSPDLVATVDLGSATVVDPHSGRIVSRLPGADVSWLAFAGSRLLVQRRGGDLEVWDARGTTLQRSIPGDPSYSWPPVGNPQGTLVARPRGEGEIVLDDLDTGAVLATFPSPMTGTYVKTGVAFAPDGRQLVTVTENSTGEPDPAEVIQRDVSSETLVRSACAAAGRDLTPAEWRSFVGTAPPADLACR
jgi:WD40 repeat protein